MNTTLTFCDILDMLFNLADRSEKIGYTYSDDLVTIYFDEPNLNDEEWDALLEVLEILDVKIEGGPVFIADRFYRCIPYAD